MTPICLPEGKILIIDTVSQNKLKSIENIKLDVNSEKSILGGYLQRLLYRVFGLEEPKEWHF